MKEEEGVAYTERERGEKKHMVVSYQQKSQKSLCVSNQSKIANYRYCRSQKQCTAEKLLSSAAPIDTIEQDKKKT